jgi:predicted Zn-dependent protease
MKQKDSPSKGSAALESSRFRGYHSQCQEQLMRPAFFLAPLLLMASLDCGVEGSGFLISDAQEAEIGAEVHQDVIAQYPLMTDPFVQSWVDQLGNLLAVESEAERSDIQYRFFVLDTAEVNAFAAPGGYIYLTRGLILEAQTEAEMAGVMGHEIGHVAHRHGVAKLERAVGVGLVSGLLFGDDTVASDVIDFATAFVLNTDYSQDQETDADNQAVPYMFDAGYNPFGLVQFFETLEALSGPSVLPDWLSSHPAPTARAENARANIAALNAGVTRNTSSLSYEITGNFDQVQAQLAY